MFTGVSVHRGCMVGGCMVLGGVHSPGGCMVLGGCMVPGGVMHGGDPPWLLLRVVRILLECFFVSLIFFAAAVALM